jgi:hypothetical protein
MHNPVIVVAAFNRAESLKRLLTSLSQAIYPTKVDLVISIDGGGPQDVVDVANGFVWTSGEKSVLLHDQNLGLRAHIISLGDLTYKYGSIILLEDDLMVSPWFYEYARAAENYYYNEDEVAGVSLYAYRNNENSDCAPFNPLNNGYDIFFMQTPSSWGQLWTKKQWEGFKAFYDHNPTIGKRDRIPENVKEWADSSWKKFYHLYLAEKKKYFVTPYFSYTTNCGEVGTHSQKKTSLWQAQLSYGVPENFRFPKFEEKSLKYDAYMEIDPACLPFIEGVPPEKLCVDLYGTKQLDLFDNKYWLTIRASSQVIRSYGIELLPLENNVLYQTEGKGINLSEKDYLKAIPQDTFHILAELNSSFSYQYGIRRGYSKVKNTKTYKLGEILSHPGRLFKKS